ncbi:hypothetical protein SAMN05216223_11752 [Actinacidiphila yanglinensis]|uniref:ABC-2 family transporter protein n=1 Tax=Actinacidiphila yanglinensis TaxID=310779 RepID=A0A1H6DLH5_9ACTN|nr:ABC transporter permease [Actinacidiphila yanglinensis]SEG86277.1 hypothetical protein SAMN05216223_11752 [Actinacidiphila yanglinensis]
MTTLTLPPALEPAPLAGPAGVPFGRLVRVELRKLVDTRASRWLLAGIAALTPVIVVVMLVAVKPHDLTYEKFVDFTQAPQKYLLPVLGILTVTSEWSQRTGLVTFTLAPNRGRVLCAKAAAALLAGLLVIVLAFVAAAAGNALGGPLRGGDGSWSFGAGGFRDIVLVLLIGLAQGLAFGMLLLVSAAAIVTYFVLPNVSSVVFNTAPGLKADEKWFDLNTSTSSLYSHDTTPHGWLQMLSATLIWVVLPAVPGVLRVLRSEVKSG